MSNGLGSKATRNEPLKPSQSYQIEKLRNQKSKTKPLNMKNKPIHEDSARDSAEKATSQTSITTRNKTEREMTTPTRAAASASLLLSASLAVGACIPAVATADGGRNETQYQQINLVSDLAGIAQVQDTNLVNGWGISYHDTFPFWVSDNGTGVTTLYAVTIGASGAPHASIVPASAIGNGGCVPGNVTVPGHLPPPRQSGLNNAGHQRGDFLILWRE